MMKKLVAILCFTLTAAVLLSSCGTHTAHFFALDTYIDLTADADEDVLNKVKSEIERVQSVFDAHNEKSALCTINRDGYGKNAEISALVKRSQEYTKQTKGYFDITLGKIVSLWDIGGKNHLPDLDEVSNAFIHCGSSKCKTDGDTVTLTDGVQLDMGGVAKGYAAERAVAVAKENGVKEAVFSLGGNIALIGNKNGDGYSVGITDPLNPETSTVGSISGMSDCYVVTSGGYQRYFEKDGKRYVHIFGSNGYPVESDLMSVTIVSTDGAAADAYSTALYAMGLNDALKFCENNNSFEAVFIDNNKNISLTDGLRGKFAVTNEGYRLCETKAS